LRRFSFDPDAIIYFSNANITNFTERVAANNLIVGFKRYGFWDTFDRVHLISPTSRGASEICAKSGQSLIEIAGTGGITFSTTGITTNGVNSALQTDIAPSACAHLTQTNSAISIMNRTAIPLSKNKTYFGCRTTLTTGELLVGSTSATNITAYSFNSGSAITTTPTNGQGFHYLSRLTNSLTYAQNPSAVVPSQNLPESSTSVTHAIYLGAFNNAGVLINPSQIEISFFSMGSVISDPYIFYQLIQQYQTDVIPGGRQV
jgi:hypothetical protein